MSCLCLVVSTYSIWNVVPRLSYKDTVLSLSLLLEGGFLRFVLLLLFMLVLLVLGGVEVDKLWVRVGEGGRSVVIGAAVVIVVLVVVGGAECDDGRRVGAAASTAVGP